MNTTAHLSDMFWGSDEMGLIEAPLSATCSAIRRRCGNRRPSEQKAATLVFDKPRPAAAAGLASGGTGAVVSGDGSGDNRCAGRQALAGRRDPDGSVLPRFRPHDREAEPVEGLALRRLERLEAGLIAVVGGHDFPGAFDRKPDRVAGVNALQSSIN